jgi:hypothetical protein
MGCPRGQRCCPVKPEGGGAPTTGACLPTGQPCPAAGSAGCPEGQTRCPDQGCVTLGSNQNCAFCSNACLSGQGCCNGVCTPLNTDTNCGGCGISCTAGANETASCATGTCVRTCLAGFTRCASSTSPLNGQCVSSTCPSGQFNPTTCQCEGQCPQQSCCCNCVEQEPGGPQVVVFCGTNFSTREECRTFCTNTFGNVGHGFGCANGTGTFRCGSLGTPCINSSATDECSCVFTPC